MSPVLTNAIVSVDLIPPFHTWWEPLFFDCQLKWRWTKRTSLYSSQIPIVTARIFFSPSRLSLELKSQFNSTQFDEYLVNLFNASRTWLAIFRHHDSPKYGDGWDKCIKCFLLKKKSGLKPLACSKLWWNGWGLSGRLSSPKIHKEWI